MKTPAKETASIRVEVNVTVPILKKHLTKGGTTKAGRLQASKDLADQLKKQIANGPSRSWIRWRSTRMRGEV